MQQTDCPPAAIAESWLSSFASALDDGSMESIAALFTESGELRDIVALTWDFTTISGPSAIAQGMLALNEFAQVRAFRVDGYRTSPQVAQRAGHSVVEAIFSFETAVGHGAGVLRILQEGAEAGKAVLVSTTLQELDGFEEKRGANRPHGTAYSRTFGGKNWLDLRREEREYVDRDPEVLVIGGGQAGLTAAARLRAIGVDALIVEKHPRIGDVWRRRYHSLTLHNEAWVASFPYLEFPDTWPTYVPKDKLAGWMEYYAEAMELNVWTSSVVTAGSYDELAGRWTITVLRDGVEVSVRPRHVVFSTGGVSGKPFMPSMPGLEDFTGEVLHSSAYTSGASYAGRKALVIGTGTSSHDVAQDLRALGSDVTIVQRGSTTVVSLEPSGISVYALYSEGLSIEDSDLISAASTYSTMVRANKILAQRMVEADADLLDRLEQVGFRTDIGEDGTGFHLKFNRRGGGYYINVGCSDLIADGDIALLQHDQIERFTNSGIALTDGTAQDYDLVVFGTGYGNQQEDVRALLGDAIADRVGKIWGFDEHGEMRNMWRPTAQPGLWFHAGSLAACRSYSKYLAVQIKAELEGVKPDTEKIRAVIDDVRGGAA